METVIDIVDLEKVYNEDRPDIAVHAVAGISLQIARGESVAIVGPSGCGKSTLMHLIGCLDRPTRGEIRLGGEPVAHMGENELARVRNRRIGFVFQTFNLLARQTAVENVALPLLYAGKHATEGPALAALDKVGLRERAYHRPSELSGGQKQRVAIARAIVNEPQILLADEPTGALDTRTGDEILRVLADQNEGGMTLVMVTHDMSVARRMRRVIRMVDGRVQADGTPDAVLGPAAPSAPPGA